MVSRSRSEFAVLVPLLDHEGERCVLLTKRPENMVRYAGQVSLPGGAREPGDSDLKATALRETHEEVGVPPTAVNVVAELDWHETTIGHRIKPFVATVTTVAAQRLVPDPREVERLLYLRVATINDDLFKTRSFRSDRDDRQHTVLTFDLDGFEVWGLTARILRSAFVDPGPARGYAESPPEDGAA